MTIFLETTRPFMEAPLNILAIFHKIDFRKQPLLIIEVDSFRDRLSKWLIGVQIDARI